MHIKGKDARKFLKRLKRYIMKHYKIKVAIFTIDKAGFKIKSIMRDKQKYYDIILNTSSS